MKYSPVLYNIIYREFLILGGGGGNWGGGGRETMILIMGTPRIGTPDSRKPPLITEYRSRDSLGAPPGAKYRPSSGYVRF